MSTPTIAMQDCTSSNITQHGYDPASQTLAVRFKNGAHYHYQGVPADLAAEFSKAKSPGSFLSMHIRGKFDATRLDTPEKGEPA